MLVVHVYICVKAEYLDEFIQATTENARNSLQEPGIARFDLVQQKDDPCKFVLVEIYRSPDAPSLHKETPHYARWRDAVEIMMAEPRYSIKYMNIFPDDTHLG